MRSDSRTKALAHSTTSKLASPAGQQVGGSRGDGGNEAPNTAKHQSVRSGGAAPGTARQVPYYTGRTGGGPRGSGTASSSAPAQTSPASIYSRQLTHGAPRVEVRADDEVSCHDEGQAAPQASHSHKCNVRQGQLCSRGVWRGLAVE